MEDDFEEELPDDEEFIEIEVYTRNENRQNYICSPDKPEDLPQHPECSYYTVR